MYCYQCSICKGMCDAGELENGICYECREKKAMQQKERRFAPDRSGQLELIFEEVIQCGFHRENLYSRQRRAYEMEERR